MIDDYWRKLSNHHQHLSGLGAEFRGSVGAFLEKAAKGQITDAEALQHLRELHAEHEAEVKAAWDARRGGDS